LDAIDAKKKNLTTKKFHHANRIRLFLKNAFWVLNLHSLWTFW